MLQVVNIFTDKTKQHERPAYYMTKTPSLLLNVSPTTGRWRTQSLSAQLSLSAVVMGPSGIA